MKNRESVQKLQIKRGFSIFKVIILNSPQCYVKSTTWVFNFISSYVFWNPRGLGSCWIILINPDKFYMLKPGGRYKYLAIRGTAILC